MRKNLEFEMKISWPILFIRDHCSTLHTSFYMCPSKKMDTWL